MIQLQQVDKSYAGRKIFDSVSLSVQAGTSLVVMGPSGQGKTLLLKLIAGLVEPDAGRVLIKQKDINGIDSKARVQMLKEMGMLFQKNALFDSMTVIDNLRFPMRETAYGTTEQIEQRAREFLQAVGLAHAADLLPSEISGGMQKRLGIARALCLDPRILLYDDPTAGLDPITSRHIIDLILRLKEQQGSSLITVTNDVQRARQLASALVFVVAGELLYFSSFTEAWQSEDPRVHQFLRGETEGPLTSLG